MTTETMPQLSPRAAQVLADVVETYGKSGEPVGSKALVEAGNYQLSGASIRNTMQDLESLGLLTHPHTSAGRIPTEDGYRYYAHHMVTTDDLNTDIKQELERQIQPGKSLAATTQDLSTAISQITNCASLVTTPRREHDPLEHMDFVRLSPERVLVVMVTAGGEIENRIIDVPAFISTEDLQKSATSLKPLLVGQTLEQARGALISAISDQKIAVNSMIDQMMAAANEWGRPITADGAMVVAGSTTLFQYPELVRDKLQQLIKIFEEKRLLMTLVDEVRKSDGVKIFVGSQVPLTAAHDCSVIANTFGSAKSNLLGTIGVIGPMRMNYKQTLGVVNYTSQLLNKAMTDKAVNDKETGK